MDFYFPDKQKAARFLSFLENVVPMKTKTSKQPKQTKATVQLKDMKPKKDAKGGAVVGRTTKGAFTGGVFVTATDVGRGN